MLAYFEELDALDSLIRNIRPHRPVEHLTHSSILIRPFFLDTPDLSTNYFCHKSLHNCSLEMQSHGNSGILLQTH